MKMNNILIIASPYIKNKQKVIKDVSANLKGLNWHIFNDELNTSKAYKTLEKIINNYDLIITLGGDGSMLRICELAAFNKVPIMGINYGGVGYLTSLKKNEIKKLKLLKEGKYKIEEHLMLQVSIEDRNYKHLALNDLLINKSDVNVPIKLKVKEGKKTEEIFADGIVVATPTGSSAYSYSAGGIILNNDENKIILTPIAPVFRKSTYKVYDGKTKLKFKSIRDNRDLALLSIDGCKAIKIDKNDLVNVEVSKYKTRIVRL